MFTSSEDLVAHTDSLVIKSRWSRETTDICELTAKHLLYEVLNFTVCCSYQNFTSQKVIITSARTFLSQMLLIEHLVSCIVFWRFGEYDYPKTPSLVKVSRSFLWPWPSFPDLSSATSLFLPFTPATENHPRFPRCITFIYDSRK